MVLIGNSNVRLIRAEEEDKVGIFMTHIIMTKEITKIDKDKIVVTEEISIDRIEVDQGMNKIIGEEILEAMQDCIKISEDKKVEENTGVIIGMKVIAEKEVGVGLEKDHFQEITIIIEGTNRSISNSRSRSGLRVSTNRDRIRCYKCREYDHFMKDCPTSAEEIEIEQLQLMLNLDEEQSSLKGLAIDTYDSLYKTNSIENMRQGHLNL